MRPDSERAFERPIARASSEPAIARPSERPIARASSEPAIARPSERPIARASSEPAIARPSERPIARASSQPAITGPITEPEINWPFSEPAPPSSIAEPEIDWSSAEAANPPSAPSESTAIYRKRNTRPTLPAVSPEPSARPQPATPAGRPTPTAHSAVDPTGDGEALPCVMLDAAPRRILRPRVPHASLGRVIVPVSLIALLMIAAWLLHMMF